MPTLPTYRGELPECLNPFNPRHYLLLVYWIFFRPTALKCYLYRADPKIYRLEMGKTIFQTGKIPANYSLYLMTLVESALLALLLNLPVTLLTGRFLNISIHWSKWAGGLTFGVFAGMAIGMVISMMYCKKFDIATSVTLGITNGMFASVSTGIWVAATAGLGVGTMAGKAFAMPMGILAGVVIGIAYGGTFNDGGTFNLKIGIIAAVIGGVAGGVIIAIMVGLLNIVVIDVEFGVAVGLLGGVVASVIVGTMFSVGGYLLSNLFGGVSFGIVCGILIGIVFGIKSGVFFGIGVLRLVFYPFQLALALCSKCRKIKHPIEWDELIILPLPYTQKIINRKFQQNEREGLYFLIQIGRNPFQRWRVRATLYAHLHKHPNPLHFLYTLLTHADWDEYMSFPPHHGEQKATAHHLFLGELALRCVNIHVPYWEQIAWLISKRLRGRHQTLLTNFAGMLYDLFNDSEKFNHSSYSEIYDNLSPYLGDQEITDAFGAMATYLSYNNLFSLAEASSISSNLTFEDPIRPTVLTALNRLGEVGAEVKTYQDSSSRANRMAALARAADTLKKLDTSVGIEIITPEKYILQQIIRQWQDLLISAGGELGRAEEVGPVVNPYVAGNPVTGELFVGRKDILRRLEELWSGDGQKPSIVLYGHRRMGKSSILHNLGTRFGKNTEIVDFNMQRAGLVFSTGELLYNLALAMYDALEASFQSQSDSESFGLAEPEEEPFMAHNPYTAFDRFLKQIDRIRGEKRFIITIDEFEMIEQKIHKGNLEALLLDFCRGLIQTYPWFIVAFAGLHTLQEMTHDYWNPLFGSVTGVPVSFLKKKAVEQLITQPTSDFSLDYERDAIDEIARLTNGQSYLVQLICHNLVSLFNRQTFEEEIERERRFSLGDVEAVIQAPEFFRDGEAYFSGVWQQALGSETVTQHDILKLLAHTESGVSIGDLVEQSGLTSEAVQQSLKFLQRHDVIMEVDRTWRFTVELMRRWVEQRE